MSATGYFVSVVLLPPLALALIVLSATAHEFAAPLLRAIAAAARAADGALRRWRAARARTSRLPPPMIEALRASRAPEA